MKIRNLLIFLIVLAVVTVAAIAVFISMNPRDTTLEFQVRDTVSKGWVWDSTITLQNRTIRGYYQTDRGLIKYRFTHLQPGEYQMKISAPSYETVSIPVNLKKGGNILEKPIDMLAYEIPGLQKFIIFEKYEGTDIVLEIRPVGIDGKAILNHPCMDLQVAAMVSVQTKNGLPVQEETEQGSQRGEILFQGKIDWIWDALPETYFRYSSRIPGSKIKVNSDPYLVIDYLILIPDPRKITEIELDDILNQTSQFEELEDLQTFLQTNAKDRFQYYFFTSWNVPGENI